ncbi:MAG: hypothetical protein ACSHXL_01220 [Bacteroidota bacterium]
MKYEEKVRIEKGQFELIKGVFSPSDALEIIMHLMQEKIKFHGVRSFNQSIRIGTKDEWSEMRIDELKQSRDQIKQLLEKAKQDGNSVNINSNISIELI